MGNRDERTRACLSGREKEGRLEIDILASGSGSLVCLFSLFSLFSLDRLNRLARLARQAGWAGLGWLAAPRFGSLSGEGCAAAPGCWRAFDRLPVTMDCIVSVCLSASQRLPRALSALCWRLSRIPIARANFFFILAG